MIARFTEFTIRPEKQNELRSVVEKDILPVLRRQVGFVDHLMFVPETKQERLVSITLWTTKNDAETYHRTEFPKILELIKPFFKGTPEVNYYNVEFSTFHKLVAGKAA